MRTERYEPKRLPANQNLAFVGAKRGTGSKSLVLTAKDILAPNYDFRDDELLLKKGSLEEQEAKACKEKLKRFSSFIAFPRYSQRLITTTIRNHDRKIIPDDSIIYITSSRCLHAGYLYSSFFHVWFEYFQLLRRDKFDFIEVFETFPFPEKLNFNAFMYTNYMDYLLYGLSHEVSVERAYDEIHSGLAEGDQNVRPHSFSIYELAEHYGLPKKYQDKKAKILERLIIACKNLELKKTE